MALTKVRINFVIFVEFDRLFVWSIFQIINVNGNRHWSSIWSLWHLYFLCWYLVMDNVEDS